MKTGGKKYLYEIVYSTLKQEIMDSVYPYDVFLPSEKDISTRFEVDRATVRKALAFLVEDGIVEKRAGAGTKVIYRGERTTPACLSNGRLIGFFIIEHGSSSKKITQPFYSDLFYQIENECKKYDANVIYSTIYNEAEYLNIISQRRFDGIIFASKTEDSYIQHAENAGIKVAQMLGYSSSGLTVCYDNVAAGTLAVNHLIEKGHKKIALITGPKDYQSSKDRFMGALSSMILHNIPLHSDYVLEGNWEYDSGYDCASKLLAMGEERPTAIYAFNDMMALGVIDAITNAGLSIPKDISIISNDNMNEIRRREQRLTTTDANVEKISEIALDYFFNSRLTNLQGIKIVVPVALVEGDTVSDLNQNKRYLKNQVASKSSYIINVNPT